MGEHLNIVVQQQQMLAVSKLRAKIVDGREVERSLIPHHLAAGKPAGDGLVVGLGSGVGGVILDDDDLKVIVPGVLVQAGQAAVQVVGVVLVGDQHADKRAACQLIPHLERPRRVGHCHGAAGQAEALQLGVDSPLPRRDGVGLGLHACGGGPCVAAPDIQHLFDMLDALCLLSQAQDQVVVLSTVKLLGLVGTGSIQQRSAEHRQMGDKVHPAQVVGRKIRLKVVTAQLFQIRREYDLVTIDKVRTRVLDGLHNLEKGV